MNDGLVLSLRDGLCVILGMRRYKTSIEEDIAVIADPTAGPREKVAARLLRIEKSILQGQLPLQRLFGQLDFRLLEEVC